MLVLFLLGSLKVFLFLNCHSRTRDVRPLTLRTTTGPGRESLTTRDRHTRNGVYLRSSPVTRSSRRKFVSLCVVMFPTPKRVPLPSDYPHNRLFVWTRRPCKSGYWEPGGVSHSEFLSSLTFPFDLLSFYVVEVGDEVQRQVVNDF